MSASSPRRRWHNPGDRHSIGRTQDHRHVVVPFLFGSIRVEVDLRLLRVGSADLIQQKVSFPGSGPDADPGVIVMLIDDLIGDDVDAQGGCADYGPRDA